MSKNDDKDLIGFKDFLDYEGQRKASSKTRTDHSGFELFTFLEQDSNRLSKLISLLEEKTYMLKNYPQDVSLLIKQEKINIDLRKKVIEKLKRDDSPLINSLNELLIPHFDD